MSARWLCGLLLLATATFGCKKLNANRCDNDQDCGGVPGSCDTTTHYCPIDGGSGGAGVTGGASGMGGHGGVGGAAGSHGTGGKAFSCADTTCSGGTPFCDMDAGGCRGCQSEGMNACKGVNDGGTLVCVTPDASFGATVGTCVGCLDERRL